MKMLQLLPCLLIPLTFNQTYIHIFLFSLDKGLTNDLMYGKKKYFLRKSTLFKFWTHKRSHSSNKAVLCKNGRCIYICDICQCRFTSLKFLIKHNRTHRGEGKGRRYPCALCPYSTDILSSIKSHMVTHSSDRPHECSYCEKSFKLKNHLDDHIRIHTGERPFLCELCNKTFRHQNNLSRHRRIHLLQKPFMCKYCEMSFVQKIQLNQHEKMHF